MFEGDIKLANNFEVNTSRPIDNRIVVETLAHANAIDFKYPGLLVYINELGVYYKWTGIEFLPLISSDVNPTAETVPIRDDSGRLTMENPVSAKDGVNKEYLESVLAAPETATIYYLDSINGVDSVENGTLNRPFRTLNYAHDRISGTGDFAGKPTQSQRTICMLNGNFSTEQNLCFKQGSTTQLLIDIFYKIEASAKWTIGNTCPFQLDSLLLGNHSTNLSVIGTSSDYVAGQGGIYLSGTAGFINVTNIKWNSSENKTFNVAIESLPLYRANENVDTVIRMIGIDGSNGRSLSIKNSSFGGVAKLLDGTEPIENQASNIYIEKVSSIHYNNSYGVGRSQSELTRFGYNILVGKGHTTRANTNTDLAGLYMKDCYISGSELFGLLGIMDQNAIINITGNRFSVPRTISRPRSKHHIVFIADPLATSWLRRSGSGVTPGAYCVIEANTHDGNHDLGHKYFAMNEVDGTPYTGPYLDLEFGDNVMLDPNALSGTNYGGKIIRKFTERTYYEHVHFPTFNIVQSESTTASAGTCFATSLIPASSMMVSSIETYISNNFPDRTVHLGLYNSNGTTLLASTTVSGAVKGFVTGQLNTEVFVKGGTRYWLAVLEGQGEITFPSKTSFSDSGGIVRAGFISNSPTGMPANINTGFTTNVNSIYMSIKS